MATHSLMYRATQAASSMGVSLPTFYRWIRQGRFPQGIKIGKNTVVWDSVTVEQWIQQQKTQQSK